MSTRSVEVEFVRYRTREMMHTARQFIYDFAQYSGIPETRQWGLLTVNLCEIIRQQLPTECIWITPVLDIRFSGIPQPIPKIKKDGGIIFAASEPRFVIEEKRNDEIRPPVRSHVERVVKAIATEMRDVYHLRINRDVDHALLNPLVLHPLEFAT